MKALVIAVAIAAVLAAQASAVDVKLERDARDCPVAVQVIPVSAIGAPTLALKASVSADEPCPAHVVFTVVKAVGKAALKAFAAVVGQVV